MLKKNNVIKLYINIIFILMSVYVLQDLSNSRNVNLLGGDRGLVHVLLVMIFILISIFTILYDIKNGTYINYFQISLIFISFWILYVGVLQKANLGIFIVHLGLSILWIMAYKFSNIIFSKYPKYIKLFFNWITILIVLYVFGTFYAQYTIRSVDGRIPVLNLVYFVMAFIPWIFLYEKSFKKNLLQILVFFVVIISFKRGAILIYCLMLPGYFVIKNIIEGNKISSTFKMLLFLLLFIATIFIVDYYSGGFLLNRFTREELISGSGRNILYELALENILNRNVIDFIFGLGSGSSISFLGNGVHNEWIEFLFSYGFVGVFLYANFLFTIIRKASILIKNKSKYAPAFGTCAIYIVVIGLFDGFYFMHSTLYLFLFMGAISGLERRKKELGHGKYE